MSTERKEKNNMKNSSRTLLLNSLSKETLKSVYNEFVGKNLNKEVPTELINLMKEINKIK